MAERKIKVYGDLTSDEKFKSEMEKIEQQGYVKTHRSNDTGIGKTLEDLLGVEENSVQAADLGSVELKANRRTSNSKITLITKAPSKRGVNNKVLRKKYGYQTEESVELNPDVNVLHSALNGNDFNTLNGKPFMKLTFQDDKMYMEHKEDGVLEDVYWKKEDIEKAFMKKYPAGKLYHVQADSKKDDDGVESPSEVKTFDLPQFHGVSLKGTAEGDPCCYACLMTKDAGSVYCISIIYNRTDDKVVERMLKSFKMEEDMEE